MNIDDGICAYLTGGLGNQLFVLAAAWEQAERLDCPLYIDTSKYLKGDLRSFELGSLNLPGIVISRESPWVDLGRRSRRFGVTKRTRKLKTYHESAFGYSPDINKITPGTTIFGYFQSSHYFQNIESLIAELLLSSHETTDEKAILRSLERDPRITLHVRRGDYTTAHTQAVHGVTSGAYFERGLGLIARISSGYKARAFSDEPEVAEDDLGHLPNVEFFKQNSELSGLNTIKAMSLGNGMVMSNSSFSWWAAWLMSRRTANTIIAPRPWMASGESAADLLRPDWITLDARSRV